MLLCATEEAHKRNWPILAQITGWGAACDAVHITAPDREASGLIAAIKKATDNCCRQVGAINAHGTGTRHNDAMEIFAFTTLWGRNNPPFHSVKGAIGHCLGAAGVIEAVLSVESLNKGLIPPSVGLTIPEPGIGHVTGQKPLALDHPSILSCNSGFGGINTSILITKPRAVIRA
jgi:3-oxoacyl-(acyl-carrier-protein) synthase